MLAKRINVKYLFKKINIGANQIVDHVEHILSQWQQARPDLDCSTMGISGRIGRSSRFLADAIESVYKRYDLSLIEMDIVATLRRSQEPLTPTQLYKTLMYSSGTMSTRIEGLVKRGLIYRDTSGEDRRSCKVGLTDEGIALADALVTDHVANLQQLMSPFSEQEQEQLAALLQKLTISFEKQEAK